MASPLAVYNWSPQWPDCCKADLTNRGRCFLKKPSGKRVAIRFMGSEGWAAGLFFVVYCQSLHVLCRLSSFLHFPALLQTCLTRGPRKQDCSKASGGNGVLEATDPADRHGKERRLGYKGFAFGRGPRKQDCSKASGGNGVLEGTDPDDRHGNKRRLGYQGFAFGVQVFRHCSFCKPSSDKTCSGNRDGNSHIQSLTNLLAFC